MLYLTIIAGDNHKIPLGDFHNRGLDDEEIVYYTICLRIAERAFPNSWNRDKDKIRDCVIKY